MSLTLYACKKQWYGNGQSVDSRILSRLTKSEKKYLLESLVGTVCITCYLFILMYKRIFRFRFQIDMQLGFYDVYWEELTRFFPREQILSLQNKDLHDIDSILKKVYKFLDLRKLPEMLILCCAAN